jgi:hypothetical protein
VPFLAAIRTERDALAEAVLPKSPLGEAVRYLTTQWDALQRFVEDGRFRIDNNGAYAARGISAGMPRPRLCRVDSLSRRKCAQWPSLPVGDAA